MTYNEKKRGKCQLEPADDPGGFGLRDVQRTDQGRNRREECSGIVCVKGLREAKNNEEYIATRRRVLLWDAAVCEGLCGGQRYRGGGCGGGLAEHV